MTIEEAAKTTNTELKDFYKKFEISNSVPSKTKMKEISNLMPGYEFDEVKSGMSD